MIEYGLLISTSAEILSDAMGNLRSAWDSVSFPTLITVGIIVIVALFLLHRWILPSRQPADWFNNSIDSQGVNLRGPRQRFHMKPIQAFKSILFSNSFLTFSEVRPVCLNLHINFRQVKGRQTINVVLLKFPFSLDRTPPPPYCRKNKIIITIPKRKPQSGAAGRAEI